MSPTYVYGLVAAETEVPPDLTGLGPSGQVSTIKHGQVAAVVSDVPTDRPLGTRDDLMAHEAVVDTLAAVSTVIPMRFGRRRRGATRTAPRSVRRDARRPGRAGAVRAQGHLRAGHRPPR